MKSARIGSLEVSVIGLGCNNFGRQLDATGAETIVSAALDAGITFFDTADYYGGGQSEGFLGRALGSRRDEVVIATKFCLPVEGVPDSGGASPDYVRRAVERSLRELGTDHIDLYQQHRPDPQTPIADTLGALQELVDAGKVREIGCSNFSAEQMREADAVGTSAKFVTNQIEYSMANRAVEHDGIADAALALDMGLIPYRPLAKGLLTGKVQRGQRPPDSSMLSKDRFQRFLTEENFSIVERLQAFADERSLTLVQVALAWLLTRPPVPSVIPGATRPEQVELNAATGSVELSAQDVTELDHIIADVEQSNA